MRFVALLLFSWCVSLGLMAQTHTGQTHSHDGHFHPPGEQCATMAADAELRMLNPRMGTLEEFEYWLQQRIQEYEAGTLPSPFKTSAVVTIPVVFHIIHNNGADNISDAMILSQLAVLNEDFSRTNPDVGNTPAAFLPVAANCEIQFCMAQRDPNGNATNGINRVNRNTAGFTAPPYTSTSYIDGTIKPATIWDPNSYLNIWVMNLGSSLLGYAQFPSNSTLSGLNANGGSANTDGVVITYTSVGRPPHNTFGGPYNGGRTATHEVGHWLGLRHIWGDGNSCSATDYCSDTPSSDAANNGCPTNHASCGSPDMVQNYMDYTNDACMNIFTLCQKTRMQTVLSVATRRASLANSLGCTPPVAAPPVASFTVSPNPACPGTPITCTNTSTGATSYSWSFPGGTPASSTATNPTVSFGMNGTYTITLTATNATGTTTATQNITVTTAGGVALPFAETFESNSFTTNSWDIGNPDNSTTWAIATVGGITPGTRAAKMDFFNYAATGQRDRMTTRTLDFTGYSQITLTFDHAYRRYNTQGTDSLIVYISNNCGATWTRLRSLGENGTGVFATGSTTTNAFTPSQASNWCFATTTNADCQVIDLTSYNTSSAVQVRFEGYNNYGNNLYVDNINIIGKPNATFTVNDQSICAGQSVNFTSTSTGNVTSQTWTFAGGSPATSTSANPTVTYNTPGTYAVTLIATNPSTSDTTTTTNYITVSAGANVTTTTTNAACGANTGTATANPSGGGPFTYSWSTSPVQTTQTATNLPAGTYTVTVTNVGGCTATATATVTNANAPTVSLSSSQNVSCNGNTDGQIVANATGGTGTITYTLNGANPQTNGTFSNLAAGTYTVTATDAASCANSIQVTITQPTALVINSQSAQDVSCNGANDGQINVLASGQGTLTYTLNANPSQASGVFTGLAPGFYSVVIEDVNGCATQTGFTIDEPAPISLTLDATTDASCATATNGGIDVSASGGTPPYTFSVPGAINSTGIFNSLAPNAYTITVEDSLGCTTTTTATVGTTNALSVAVDVTAPTGGLNNGELTANVTGAQPPVQVVWNTVPQQFTETITGLGTGTYIVTVTDGSGCSVADTVQLGVISVADGLGGGSLNIYPNPTQGLLYLDAHFPSPVALTVQVYNAVGQAVRSETLPTVSTGVVSLDISSLSNGIYTLRLLTPWGSSTHKVSLVR